MKVKAKNKSIIILLFIVVVVLCAGLYLLCENNKATIFADSVDGIVTQNSDAELEELFAFHATSDNKGYSVRVRKKDVKEIKIPLKYNNKPITEIYDNGFANCVNLVKIDILGIKKIGNNAFYNCRNLEEIINYGGVKEIKDNAFANCTKVKDIIIPSQMKTFGSNLFRNNPNRIYSRMPEAEMNALNPNWCANMADTAEIVYLDEGTLVCDKLIKDDNVYGYKIKSNQTIKDIDLVIPSTYNGLPILEISKNAFSGCRLNSITIKHNEESSSHSINICSDAFSYTETDYIDIYVDITLNDHDETMDLNTESRKSINVFAGSFAKRITLPDSLNAIPDNTFFNCINLEEIRNINPNIKINQLSSNIVNIGNEVFSWCNSLKAVYIPNSVDNLGNTVFGEWDESQTIYFDFYKEQSGWLEKWDDCINGAKIEYKKAIITLDKDGGTENIGTDEVAAYVDYDMPQADAPQRRGYEFTGYYTQPDGEGEKYYNPDMSSAQIWNIESDYILYADWDIIYYDIDYYIETCTQFPGYNGTLLSDYGIENHNPNKYTVEDEIIFENVQFGKYTIVMKRQKIDKGSIGNLRVESRATVYLETEAERIVLETFEKLYIYMPPTIKVKCDIIIESKVVQLNVYGNSSADYIYPCSIQINNGIFTSILLDKIKMRGLNADSTICSDGSIELLTYGNVEIYGTESLYRRSPYEPMTVFAVNEDNNGTVINRGVAIRCSELKILPHGALSIYGRDGEDGHTDDFGGTNGENGASAIQVLCNKLSIHMDPFDYYNVNVVICAGRAGNGGDGKPPVSGALIWSAGKGGKGGKGALPIEGNGEEQVVVELTYNVEIAKNLHLLGSKDGIDGITYPNVYPNQPDIPTNPDKPITPPKDPIYPVEPPISYV
ncbi:leucine-rich repeat protein [Anaerocaecibacter muris]|uniref:leucine-rich repeat protein n=1 Tax=Anaerocaecibacter muris TaxID=2941513 RepID=UPI00203B7B6E|nr:leucine-rich repeat protein [Anaerocaecibacter muris]